MTLEELLALVQKAVKFLYERDQILFDTRNENNRIVSERAIVHRLGIYLELILKDIRYDPETDLIQSKTSVLVDFEIDNEYNRAYDCMGKCLIYSDLEDSQELFIKTRNNNSGTDWTKFLSKFDEKTHFCKAKKEIAKAITSKNSDEKAKASSPDLVIHQRQQNELQNNLLVVEVKHHWDAANILLDLIKVNTFTKRKDSATPSYQYGLFLFLEENFQKMKNDSGNSWIFTSHNNDCIPTVLRWD